MSFGEFRDATLRTLADSVSVKNRQLQQAIRSGNDELVRVLDREIDPLLAELISFRAEDTDDIYLQLRLVTSLLREDADDRSCVLRHAAMLSLLVERYFGPRKMVAAPEMPVAYRMDERSDGDDEMLNEAILNNLPERVAVVTRDYRYLFANPAMATMLGVSQMELIGRSVFEIGLEAQASDAMRKALDIAFSGRSDAILTAFRTGSSPSLSLKARLSPLRASNGSISGAVLSLGDAETIVDGMAA